MSDEPLNINAVCKYYTLSFLKLLSKTRIRRTKNNYNIKRPTDFGESMSTLIRWKKRMSSITLRKQKTYTNLETL